MRVMRTEQERGQIIISAYGGEKHFQARGYVDFDSLVDTVSQLGLSEKRASRIKKIITAGSDQVRNLLATGGAITTGGRIVAMGEGDRHFVETFFISKPEKVITHAEGADVEGIARFRNQNELYLRPREKVIILRENAGSQLGFDVYRTGCCNLRFAETGSDKVEYEGLQDADSLFRAVSNRFSQLYQQTGIAQKGSVRSGNVVQTASFKHRRESGRSVLKIP